MLDLQIVLNSWRKGTILAREFPIAFCDLHVRSAVSQIDEKLLKGEIERVPKFRSQAELICFAWDREELSAY